MNNLELIFKKEDFPYINEPYDKDINWGEIILAVYSNQNILIKEVFKIKWDIKVILNWFIINKEEILQEKFSLKNRGISIAEKIFNFYNVEEDIDDNRLDQVFEYRQKHGIRFGLRGTETPDVYLGKNNDTFEVSLFNKNESWKYEIDLEPFYDNINLNYQHIII